MENYLTKDKVKVILDNAPAGSDKNKVIEALINKGYVLEGLNEQEKLVQPEIPKPQGETGLKGYATGAAKGIGSTLKGAGTLGNILLQQTAGRAVEALTGKPKARFSAIRWFTSPSAATKKASAASPRALSQSASMAWG